MEADIARAGGVGEGALRGKAVFQDVELLVVGGQRGVGGHQLAHNGLPGGEQIVQLLGELDIVQIRLAQGSLGHLGDHHVDLGVIGADLLGDGHAVLGVEPQEGHLLLVDLLLLVDDVGHLVLEALFIEHGHLLLALDQVPLTDQVADGVVILGGDHVFPADDDAGELHVPLHRIGAQSARGGP